MNIYLTTGTLSFLQSFQEKHEDRQLILMTNASTASLLQETEGKSLFQSARKYEVIDSFGPLSQEGFFAFYHIPISSENRPVFEHEAPKQLKALKEHHATSASRFLRPVKSDVYILLTVWESEQSYARWKKAEKTLFPDFGPQKTQVLFTGNPYTTTFQAYKKDKAQDIDTDF